MTPGSVRARSPPTSYGPVRPFSSSHLLPGADGPVDPNPIVIRRPEPKAAVLVHGHRPPYPRLAGALMGDAFKPDLAPIIWLDRLAAHLADILHGQTLAWRRVGFCAGEPLGGVTVRSHGGPGLQPSGGRKPPRRCRARRGRGLRRSARRSLSSPRARAGRTAT